MSKIQVDFSQYVVSLARGVMTGLGEIPDPETQTKQQNLDLARHGICVLQMLFAKTEGNLSPDEKKLLLTIIDDLTNKLAVAEE